MFIIQEQTVWLCDFQNWAMPPRMYRTREHAYRGGWRAQADGAGTAPLEKADAGALRTTPYTLLACPGGGG